MAASLGLVDGGVCAQDRAFCVRCSVIGRQEIAGLLPFFPKNKKEQVVRAQGAGSPFKSSAKIDAHSSVAKASSSKKASCAALLGA